VAGTHYREVLEAPLPVLRDLFEELDVDPPEKIFVIAKEKKESVIGKPKHNTTYSLK
jgi:hypothetical protein